MYFCIPTQFDGVFSTKVNMARIQKNPVKKRLVFANLRNSSIEIEITNFLILKTSMNMISWCNSGQTVKHLSEYHLNQFLSLK